MSLLVLLDVNAAFDTVDYKLLLDILERYFVIRDKVLKSYISYLTERTQTFHVETEKSKTFAFNCSLSQGSVVGPLQFIAYTEDLLSVIEENKVDPYRYADDGQLNDHLLLYDVGAAIPNMENCVDTVHRWHASKHLQLNPSKAAVIWFGTNAIPRKLQSVDLSLHVGADTSAPVDTGATLV